MDKEKGPLKFSGKTTLFFKEPLKIGGLRWGRWDSNPHAQGHMILSHARLPIPTLPQTLAEIIKDSSLCVKKGASCRAQKASRNETGHVPCLEPCGLTLLDPLWYRSAHHYLD